MIPIATFLASSTAKYILFGVIALFLVLYISKLKWEITDLDSKVTVAKADLVKAVEDRDRAIEGMENAQAAAKANREEAQRIKDACSKTIRNIQSLQKTIDGSKTVPLKEIEDMGGIDKDASREVIKGINAITAHRRKPS